MLRRAVVITYSALAIAPACTSTSATPLDGGDDAASDAGACPGRSTSCAVGTADLQCNDVGGYPYAMSCLGGVWCLPYTNPPSPPALPGECPATPPTNGTPCTGAEAIVRCAYQCASATAVVVCNHLEGSFGVWCGIVDPSCTLISDAGAGDAALIDASNDGNAAAD